MANSSPDALRLATGIMGVLSSLDETRDDVCERRMTLVLLEMIAARDDVALERGSSWGQLLNSGCSIGATHVLKAGGVQQDCSSWVAGVSRRLERKIGLSANRSLPVGCR